MPSQDSLSDTSPANTITYFIHQLRATYGVPVNFIESDERVEVSLPTISENVAASLDAVVGQTKKYRWRTVVGRYIVYPSEPVWDTRVSGIAITEVPRLDAATQYITAIQSQIHALEDLVAPPMKGDPRAPVYTAPVSLHSESSVLEHLVELLGTSERLVFTIERSPSNHRVMYFEQLAARQTPGVRPRR